MGDKGRHRTRDWKKIQREFFLTALAECAIKEQHFKRLRALGIIKEEQ